MRGYHHITTKNTRNTIKVNKLKIIKPAMLKREVCNAENNIEMKELPKCCWWECKIIYYICILKTQYTLRQLNLCASNHIPRHLSTETNIYIFRKYTPKCS